MYGAHIDNDGTVIWVGIGGLIPCDTDVNVGWVYANDEFSKPFALTKKEKNEQLKAWHDEQTAAMRAKYSQSEVEAFLDKRTEALAWRKDNSAQTPYVMAMAGGDEAKRLELIQAILAKVDDAAQLEGYVLMKRDEIEACNTQEELEAVTW